MVANAPSMALLRVRVAFSCAAVRARETDRAVGYIGAVIGESPTDIEDTP